MHETCLALTGCYVISLRPVGEHAALRRAAARHGARLLALSPCKLHLRDDTNAREQLQTALRATHVIATSPAAVRAADALSPLGAYRSRHWFAVGTGTAQALHRAGITDVCVPQRMDSEGLLALPALRTLAGTAVGLITAPGGRGRIAPALQQRGARVLRADVYARVPVRPSSRAIATLQALDAPAWLMLSSSEALLDLLDALPATAVDVLCRAYVVAASERLALLARDHGFAHVVVAANARPANLLAAAAQANRTAQPRAIR